MTDRRSAHSMTDSLPGRLPGRRSEAGIGYSSSTTARADEAPIRRVREEVRDSVAVAATSVAASVGLVLIATVLMRLA